MPQRLSDRLLDSCRGAPNAPLAGDPQRDLGLHKEAYPVQLTQLKGYYLDEQQ